MAHSIDETNWQAGVGLVPRCSQRPLGVAWMESWPNYCRRQGAPCSGRAGYLKPTDRPKGQSSGFLRSGRIQGSTGPARRGSGASKGPLEWSHGRFGRGRYFFADPNFGLIHPIHPKFWSGMAVERPEPRNVKKCSQYNCICGVDSSPGSL